MALNILESGPMLAQIVLKISTRKILLIESHRVRNAGTLKM